jgi:hypothetical protein
MTVAPKEGATVAQIEAEWTDGSTREATGPRRRSRRRNAMMRLLVAGVGLSALSRLGPQTARAANGDAVLAGQTVDETTPTRLRNGVSYTPDSTADGVQGYATGANNAGLFGRNNVTGGIGVGGAAPSGTGVFGESSNGFGVGGSSNTGTAVAGSSTSGAGVSGASNSSYGVSGISNGAIGVYGGSTSTVGVASTLPALLGFWVRPRARLAGRGCSRGMWRSTAR